MDFKSKITLWLRHIWVKYRRLVLVIFIGWLIIFMINMIIKNRRPQVVLKNTYDPDTAVITNDNAPTRYQDKIKAAMDEYIKYCTGGKSDAIYYYDKDNHLIKEKMSI